MVENIELKILRYTPSNDIKPAFEKYIVPLVEGMTVLDLLLYVKENLDNSISFRHSCRMGICGSCAAIVNDKPVLTCQTQVSKLGSKNVEIRPIENFPIIRDLVCDFDEFYIKHREINPYIIQSDKSEKENLSLEILQTHKELNNYFQFSLCIKCGLCFSICPITSTNANYLGPHSLSQAYRYLADSRDQDNHKRINKVNARHGCWGCHLAEACSESCPKGVDPALGIQLLRRMIIRSHFK